MCVWTFHVQNLPCRSALPFFCILLSSPRTSRILISPYVHYPVDCWTETHTSRRAHHINKKTLWWLDLEFRRRLNGHGPKHRGSSMGIRETREEIRWGGIGQRWEIGHRFFQLDKEEVHRKQYYWPGADGEVNYYCSLFFRRQQKMQSQFVCLSLSSSLPHSLSLSVLSVPPFLTASSYFTKLLLWSVISDSQSEGKFDLDLSLSSQHHAGPWRSG